MISVSLPDLEVRNLIVKKGGITTLDIQDLKVYHGEVLAIIGPNGAGKTTLLNALSLLEKPFKGDIFFKGERVNFSKNLTPLRKRMGVVFQDLLLFDTTVYKNVAAGLRFRGIRSEETRRRIDEALGYFGILHLIQRYARKLSGGEASRVSMARAFVLRPDILFLDEPFSSLDPPTRELLLSDLERVISKTRTTSVFITHEPVEAIRLADRIAIMKEGKIIQVGTYEEVIRFPQDEFIANFVGVETILPCKVIRRNGGSFIASIKGKEIEAVGDVMPDEEIMLCIRSENVTLSIGSINRDKISTRNIFPGIVRKITPIGHYFRASLDCGFPLTTYITRHSIEKLAIKEGKEVSAHFKAAGIHVIKK